MKAAISSRSRPARSPASAIHGRMPRTRRRSCTSSCRDLNWAGFYFLRGGGLVVGPFQGRVACVRIPLGQGVCGTAASRRATLIVPDVHRFPGHIACDAASNSEIVVPLVDDDRLIGVLDLDSPRRDRFTPDDARLLESLAQRDRRRLRLAARRHRRLLSRERGRVPFFDHFARAM